MAEQKLGLKVQAKTEQATGALNKFKSGVLGLNAATLGLTVGIGSVVLSTKKLITLALEQERAEKKLAATIKSTGMAAGLTFDELTKMASGLQEVTTFGDEAIIEAESLLLTFTKIGKDVFPEALETILDVSAGMGQDLKASAIQLGKALNDPILGITALSRTGIQFTEDQKQVIKTMVEAGDVAGAQAVILKELNTQFGGQAKAAAKGLGSINQLSNSLGDLGETMGAAIGKSSFFQGAIDFLKDSTDDLIDALGDARDEIEGLTGSENELIKIEQQLIDRGVEIKDGLKEQIEASKEAAEKERILGIDRKFAAAEAKDEAIAIFEVAGVLEDNSSILDETTQKLKERRKELQEQIKTEKEFAATAEERARKQKKAAEREAILKKEREAEKKEITKGDPDIEFEKFRAEEKQKIIDEQREKDLEQLKIFNESKNELVVNQFELERQLLQEDFFAKFEIVKGNDEAVTALREANAKKREDIAKREADFVMKMEKQKFMAAVGSINRTAFAMDFMASEIKELAVINKIVQMATAGINTAVAITHALASAPPPLNFIEAGVVGAAGAVQVAKIASTSFQTSIGMERIVPGPSTQAVPIMAHGQERIGRGGSGITFAPVFNGPVGDPDAVAEVTFNMLNDYQKRNGAVLSTS